MLGIRHDIHIVPYSTFFYDILLSVPHFLLDTNAPRIFYKYALN